MGLDFAEYLWLKAIFKYELYTELVKIIEPAISKAIDNISLDSVEKHGRLVSENRLHGSWVLKQTSFAESDIVEGVINHPNYKRIAKKYIDKKNYIVQFEKNSAISDEI